MVEDFLDDSGIGGLDLFWIVFFFKILVLSHHWQSSCRTVATQRHVQQLLHVLAPRCSSTHQQPSHLQLRHSLTYTDNQTKSTTPPPTNLRTPNSHTLTTTPSPRRHPLQNMSSYLSNLLTNTTSRYASLRRTLLSNEEDGDTPDDSHISRVLRAYYTEKARPYPPWLPPDPNDRRANTPQPARAPYGSHPLLQQQQGQGNRGSLNDLWDPQPTSQAPQAPQSLRAGRRAPASQQTQQTVPASSLAPPAGARPLPSQRAGSYQSFQSTGSARPGAGGVVDPSPPPSSGGGGTAQERLKARLWGAARAASPGPGSAGGSSAGGGGNPYDQGYDGGGGGGSGRRFGRVT